MFWDILFYSIIIVGAVLVSQRGGLSHRLGQTPRGV